MTTKNYCTYNIFIYVTEIKGKVCARCSNRWRRHTPHSPATRDHARATGCARRARRERGPRAPHDHEIHVCPRRGACAQNQKEKNVYRLSDDTTRFSKFAQYIYIINQYMCDALTRHACLTMLHGLTQTCAPHIRTTRAGSHGLTHARSLYRDRVSDAVSGVLGRDVGTHTPYR